MVTPSATEEASFHSKLTTNSRQFEKCFVPSKIESTGTRTVSPTRLWVKFNRSKDWTSKATYCSRIGPFTATLGRWPQLGS